MIPWDEDSEKVMKITPDKELARSILKMMHLRSEYLGTVDVEKYTAIVIEGYYEVVKEGITALMAIDGFKTLSHEVLVGYLENCKEFTGPDVQFIDHLRIVRNNIVYRGFFVKKDYWERNKSKILQNIERLERVLEQKLGE